MVAEKVEVGSRSVNSIHRLAVKLEPVGYWWYVDWSEQAWSPCDATTCIRCVAMYYCVAPFW